MLKPWGDASWEPEALGAEFEFRHQIASDPDELARALSQGVHILLACRDISVGRRLLEGARDLIGVVSYSVNDASNVDLDAATRLGILVTSTPGSQTNAVAEHTIALLLASARRIVVADQTVRLGAWHERERLVAVDIAGSVLGLCGWGKIAACVAQKAEALGMRVIVHSTHVAQDSLPYPVVTMAELLPQSDFLSLHARRVPSDPPLIGVSELRGMKPTAYLINTARGFLIDETALARALREGWIAGAALDVLREEPPTTGNPLFGCPNLLLTPHLAWNTHQVREAERKAIAGQIRDMASGARPGSLVNPDAWPHRRLWSSAR